MINNNRIVPIEKIDLITLYSAIIKVPATFASVTQLLQPIAGSENDFAVGTIASLASAPLRSCNFENASGTLFFVPDYDFKGFTVDGNAATIADGSAAVDPDGCTLYKATLHNGSVTVEKMCL